MKQKTFRIILLIGLNIILIFCIDILFGHWYLYKTDRQYYSHELSSEYMNRNRVANGMYHHGFVPNTSVEYSWGGNTYPLYVNSLGLLDNHIRVVPQHTDKYRILFLGDSFTEGVGFPYDQTFVGLVSQKLSPDSYDVLNAGVQSYSPKLYLQKTKFLLNNMGVNIDEMVIFLDISDIMNEAIEYKQFAAANTTDIMGESTKHIEHSSTDQLLGFFIDNSFIVNSVYTWWENSHDNIRNTSWEWVSSWINNEAAYHEFGKEGLTLSRQYMSELVTLLREHNVNSIVLAVYPWPNILKLGIANSKHIGFWEEFSKQEKIQFINLFPEFVSNQQKENLFIPGDLHFNENGHKLVADILLTRGIFPNPETVKEMKKQ
jgi:lysophospholipase L1-like esterase